MRLLGTGREYIIHPPLLNPDLPPLRWEELVRPDQAMPHRPALLVFACLAVIATSVSSINSLGPRPKSIGMDSPQRQPLCIRPNPMKLLPCFVSPLVLIVPVIGTDLLALLGEMHFTRFMRENTINIDL